MNVEVNINTDGLMGGKMESSPYVAVHATWGEYRVPHNLAFVPDQWTSLPESYHLPTLKEWRGDEALWFVLFAHTSYSGQSILDRREFGVIERTLQCGFARVPISALAKANQQPITIPFFDKLIFRQVTAALQRQNGIGIGNGNPGYLPTELVRLAEEASRKGMLTIRATFPKGWTLPPPKPGLMLYESKECFEASKKMDKLAKLSLAQFSDIGNPMPGLRRYRRNPYEKIVDRLHMLGYDAVEGPLPAYLFWCQDIAQRPFLGSIPEGLKASDLSEQFWQAALTSACLRKGMNPREFIQAVKEQTRQLPASTEIHANFLKAVEVVCSVGTTGANQADYLSDGRYPNQTWMKNHPDLAALLNDANAYGKTSEIPFIGGESFDGCLLYGTSRSADCEDSGMVATSISRILALQSKERKWKSRLVQAAAKLLEHYYIFDIGGSVTAPFLDTDGKAKPPPKGLTMIGDTEDQELNEGGHAFGIEVSGASAWRALRLGEITDVQPPRKFAAWEYLLPILIVEGTGPLAPYIEPTSDVFACTKRMTIMVKKEKARIAISQYIQQHCEGIRRLCGIEGTPTATEHQDPRQRISGFYRAAVHLMSPDLSVLDPRIAQLVAIDLEQDCRGVDMGTLLRELRNPQNNRVAFRSPFDPAMTKKEYETEIMPYVECVMNQAPVSGFARYFPDAEPHVHQSHILAPEMMSVMSKSLEVSYCNKLLEQDARLQCTMLKEKNLLDPNPERSSTMLERLKKIEHANERDDLAVLTLYTHSWKITKHPKEMALMTQDLETLKQKGLIEDYVFIRDRLLPQCDDAIQALLAVKVV